MVKNWIDISVEMRDGMVHWPGDPECHVSLHVKLGDPMPGQPGKTIPCNLTKLSLSAHTGTHMDAPRHFVADVPPPALVETMAKVFLDTGGDLKEVTKAMVSSPESWTAPATKLKLPGEWTVGMVRAAGITQTDPVRFTAGQTLLGERLWRPPSPKGYADDEATWIDGMGRRLDIANNFSERAADKVDPQDVIENVLGSCVSDEAKQAVGRAESRQQALVLLFMSAEFQRR